MKASPLHFVRKASCVEVYIVALDTTEDGLRGSCKEGSVSTLPQESCTSAYSPIS